MSIIDFIKKTYHILFRKKSTIDKLRSVGVVIGSNCSIGDIGVSSEPYLITIGNHVQITDGTKIFTHGAAWVFREKEPDFDCFGRVTIGDNVYIGNNCLILPGVTIGNDVVIGAGSIVTKSCNSGVYCGNPARRICSLDELYKKMYPLNVHTKGLNYKDKMAFLVNNDKFIKK